MILPQMEGNTAYNAFNFWTNPMGVTGGAASTRLGTRYLRAGFVRPTQTTAEAEFPMDIPAATSYANWGPAPINPATGTFSPTIPVSNYAGSFGDNYCGGVLAGDGLPWETPYNATPPLGQTRIGWNGYWGTSFGGA